MFLPSLFSFFLGHRFLLGASHTQCNHHSRMDRTMNKVFAHRELSARLEVKYWFLIMKQMECKDIPEAKNGLAACANSCIRRILRKLHVSAALLVVEGTLRNLQILREDMSYAIAFILAAYILLMSPLFLMASFLMIGWFTLIPFSIVMSPIVYKIYRREKDSYISCEIRKAKSQRFNF